MKLFNFAKGVFGSMDRGGWLIPLVCIALLGLGCSRESADDLFTKGEAATHQVSTYPEAESNLKKFLGGYPDDPRADVALQALARVLLSLGKSGEAVDRYEELIRRFPDSRYVDQAQFMIGYIYDQNGEYEKARAAYQKVIDTYPHSELIDDSRVSLANLGRPLETWLPSDSTHVDTVQNR